jgi:hypothetical protein
MPDYLKYSPAVETLEEDEEETQAKIIEVMSDGLRNSQAEHGRTVRISHAKAHGLLKGKLTVESGLAPELAQGLFARPATYDVLIRMASAPGEYTDDSKINTVRGLAMKIVGVAGPKLAGHKADTQDWVLDTGKEFINSGPKAFLQTFKPNAGFAPKLSDSVKGAVSEVARVTNEALNAIGVNSEKLDFFGHPKVHPAAEAYFSQLPLRYGDYVAKLALFPSSPGLKELAGKEFSLDTPDALRDLMNDYFRTNDAEFTVAVQLNTGLEDMPIEDGQAKWSEELSPFRVVAHLTIPSQSAFDDQKQAAFEDLSFSPAHTLAAHQPLGGLNRARLVVYKALADLRLSESGKTAHEPTGPAPSHKFDELER